MQHNQRIRKIWLVVGVSILVLLLAGYKYLPDLMANRSGQGIQIFLIPFIGISFITFESISYLVDVYRKDAGPGTFLDYAVFISLFPKLLSGPIVLWKDLSTQFKEHRASLEDITDGLERIMLSYSKKAILADSLAAQIQTINLNTALSGMDAQTAWLKAILYFFQLYYDFSGYSDIAIGLCAVFGFKIIENFDLPYTSASLTEFWRRWHISLGSWFREYVYIPAGGNRRGNIYFNLFLVFLLTGIWHGSGFTFLIWGAAHGIVIATERFLRNRFTRFSIPRLVGWLYTTVFVFFGWILFSSKDLSDFGNQITNMFSSGTSGINFTWRYFLTLKTGILLTIAGLGAFISRWLRSDRFIKVRESLAFSLSKKVFLIIAFIIAILFMVNTSYSPFLYQQF